MTYKRTIALALILALLVLIRQTDALIVLVVALWGVGNFKQLGERFALFWRNWKKIAVLVTVGLLGFMPQLIYYKVVTGNWFVYSYRGESFDFLHPELWNILFSTDRGAVFWAPILALALIGLPLMRKHLKEWAIALYVFLPTWLWIMSSWHSWQFGVSYGHRIFIDIFPFLALPIALVLHLAKKTWLKWALWIFIFTCVLANLVLTYHYWVVNILPGMSIADYLNLWLFAIKLIFLQGIEYGVFGLLFLALVTLGPLTYYFLGGRETAEDKQPIERQY
jgi:hypothetical protein